MEKIANRLPAVFVKPDKPLVFADDEVTVIAPYNQEATSFDIDDDPTTVYERSAPPEPHAVTLHKVTGGYAATPLRAEALPSAPPIASPPAPRTEPIPRAPVPKEPLPSKEKPLTWLVTPALCLLGVVGGAGAWYFEQRAPKPNAARTDPAPAISETPAPQASAPPVAAPEPSAPAASATAMAMAMATASASAMVPLRKAPRHVATAPPAPKKRVVIDATSDLARAEDALAAKLSQTK